MSWVDKLLKAFSSVPTPPPAEEAPPAPRPERPRSWQAELLAEADRSWSAAGGLVEAEAALQDVADAALAPAEAAGLKAPAWVAPATDQPRATFTRLGYEPGARPPSLPALKDLFDRVYGPCLAPVPGRVVHDLALYAALEGWRPGDQDQNGARLQVVFRQLSAIMGDALAFKPAPLGRVDRHRTLGGYYDHAEQAIFLATSLLASHPAAVVNTIVHEQAHRLQHLLIQRLTYAPRKLTPAERSLALYWYEEGTAQPGADYAKYRYNGREYHADQAGKAVVKVLMPVFGWGPEALRY